MIISKSILLISVFLAGALFLTLIFIILFEKQRLNKKIRKLQKALEEKKDSNSRFNFFFEQALMPFAEMNYDGTQIRLNKCFSDTFGYTDKDIASIDKWWELAYPNPGYRSQVQKEWKEIIQEGSKRGVAIKGNTYSVRCKNKEVRQVVLKTSFLKDRILLTFFDVTELTRMQQEVARCSERFQSLFNLMPISTLIFDTNGRFLMVNQFFCDNMHMSISEVIGKNSDVFTAKVDPVDMEKIRTGLKDKGVIKNLEISLEIKGSQKYNLINACLIDWLGEKAIISSIIDTTERKQREKELQLTQFSFDKAAIGIYHIAMDNRILNANQHAANMLGRKREEISGMKLTDIDASINNEKRINIIKNILEKDSYAFESIHKRKDGRIIPVEVTITQLSFEDDQFYIAFVQDITDRKKADLALHESEARFKALHNASFGGIGIHDKGIILECNQGLSEITGYSISELIGMHALSLISEKTKDLIRQKVRVGYEKPYEAIGVRKNGEEYPVRLEARNIPHQGKIVRVLEFRDITELKRAEEEHEKLQARLVQSQKMEAIGTLAGGIAHDFNNILSVLMGFTDLAIQKAFGNEKILGYLEKISSASLRARDLVTHIMTFSRKADIEKRLILIDPIIKETLKFMRASLPANINIKYNFRTNNNWVFGDPTHIHQIFMNLFTNAGHAMKEKGGLLEVSLDTININKEDKINFQELSPGSYLHMIISDTGCGIAEEHLNKVFEPFFTTKKRGEGSGMGLSTVYGIVQEMGGIIYVYSKKNMGTTFHIMVPKQKAEYGKTESFLNKPILTGDGKILLVDDERPIVEGSVELLSDIGYEVTGITSSVKALKMIKDSPNYFDLVLTDLAMPEMSGIEFSKKIKLINPDIPIVLCTGFKYGMTKEVCREAGIFKVIMKPLMFSELSKIVYNAMKNKAMK